MSGNEFQLQDTPLMKGVTFLEASAGTGKTYTISKLVVRLVVEEEIPVSSILVMTFTEAATRELKNRIRQAILEMAAQLNNPESTDPLAIKYRGLNTVSAIRDRLRKALATFDEAAIFTIHGFCHRVLNEFAFESNTLFEPTLIKEPTPLWKEAITDFWRSEYYESDAFIPALLEWKKQTPDQLLRQLLVINRHPHLEVLPATDDRIYAASVDTLRKTWEEIRRNLPEERGELFELLGNDSWFKQPLRGHIPNLLAILERDVPSTPNVEWLATMESLTPESLSSVLAIKHSDTPLEATLLKRFQSFGEQINVLIHHQLFYCLRRVHKKLAGTKHKENLLTFDDLLPSLLNTLESSTGARLQGIIQAKYSAVLVDEFQDTDPQQTELFKRLFLSKDHLLYFIGDPKQAVYKFRGADIFSYIAARELARQTFTLSKNWRSDPKLIEAVNAIFSFHKNPFLFEAIEFHPSTAALPGKAMTLDKKALQSPFKFCFLASEDKKPVDSGLAKNRINRAMSAEILNLLGGAHSINDKVVIPSDMAILTRSNREAHSVREELSAHNIPSVIFSDQTVFETRDAEILHQVLSALLEPKRLDWIRCIYVSEWFDWSTEDLKKADWSEIQETLYEIHLSWINHGIVQAMEAWMRRTQVKTRLLSRIRGERNATNLLHLVELLGQAEMEWKYGPQSLLQWFTKSMKNPDRERDDFLTRLESDEQAVQIVTIHKSKGLQYPIVFVPFAWSPVLNRKNEPWIYHRKASNHKLVYDNRSDAGEEDTGQFNKESLSDAVRLLYVALTRAEHNCYLFWGDFKTQENSPIGLLMGLGTIVGIPAYHAPAEALKALKGVNPIGMEFLDVDSMASQVTQPFRRYTERMKLAARSIKRLPDRGFHISSFSSLATGFMEAIEDTLSEDEGELPVEPDNPTDLNIFTMDKGRVAGNLLHDILEQSDFQRPQSILDNTELLGRESLLGNSWIPVLQSHLLKVVGTPLPNPHTAVRLNQMAPKNCLKEIEFHFPTRNTSTTQLLAFFSSIAREQFATKLPGMASWDETILHGYLRGFIDLLFCWNDRYFILDWKSNWLGNHPTDYDNKAMTLAMGHHTYFLQYHLYTLATVRYLQKRLPEFDYEKHFGGVYYLFIRGIDSEYPGSGVFFDRPSKENIQKLDDLFKNA